MRRDQFRQTFHPKLDIAKQLGCKIFRPQLALEQRFPLHRRRVRQTVTPHQSPYLLSPIKTDSPTLQSNRFANPFLSPAPHPCCPLPLAGIPLLSIRVHLRDLRARVFSRSLPRFVLRQNFTTDFTDSTDETLAVRINSLSVSSVQSVVQSSAVAAVRFHWPGFLPARFRRLIKRQLREFPQQIRMHRHHLLFLRLIQIRKSQRETG
jgi:hypothetical protein